MGTSNLEKATEEYKKYPKERQGDIAKAIVDSLSDKDDYSELAETNNFSGRRQALEWLMANRAEAEDSGVLASDIVNSAFLLSSDFPDYLRKMPEGAIKDHVLRDLSNVFILNAKYEHHSYEEAFELTDQIKDPFLRLDAKLRNIKSWIKDEPEAARDWIQEKSGFSDEEKQKQFKVCDEVLKQARGGSRDYSNYTGETTISVSEN